MSAPNYFVPNQVTITNIFTGTSSGLPILVILTTPNTYQTGLVVRFVIPPARGMIQLNGSTAVIRVINNITFIVSINGTAFDPFIPYAFSPVDDEYIAQAIPIGEDALVLSNLSEAVNNNNNIIPEILGPLPLTSQYQIAAWYAEHGIMP